MEEDRISQLPEPILENVISFLPQDVAVRTCVLSKSWRHLGPTRPKIEFRESSFKGSKEKFMSVVENTLQRYDEKNLSVEELNLLTWPDPGSNKSCPLLNKWVVRLQILKRLSLHLVYIEDETFENIMSSCPLIQHLVLDNCRGFSALKVSKARNLKHLDCSGPFAIDIIEIDDDDAPSLETIRIMKCQNWYRYYNHTNNNNNYYNNYFFPRLKSLYLWSVHLTTTESFDNLSSLCPFLEELQLHGCSGFTEFKLTSCSIKRLIISDTSQIEVAYFDVPNILYFEFRSDFYLPTISFATTSRECKSVTKLWHSSADVLSSTWSLKLHEFLKAISISQISLHISCLPTFVYDDGGSNCEPLVVEHFWLRYNCSSYQLRLLLNCLFRICRPRYIGLSLYYSKSQKIRESELAESIWKTLVSKGETTKSDFWQQDLEESSIQVSDKNTNEWRDVQVCALSNHQSIRFRLKWRDLS